MRVSVKCNDFMPNRIPYLQAIDKNTIRVKICHLSFIYNFVDVLL